MQRKNELLLENAPRDAIKEDPHPNYTSDTGFSEECEV